MASLAVAASLAPSCSTPSLLKSPLTSTTFYSKPLIRISPLRSSSGFSRGLCTVAMANPSPPTKPGDIQEKLSESIKEAEAICAGDGASGECAAAWDEVEELSAEISHKRKVDNDPLEKFCKEVPEADECRVYED